MTFFTVSKNPRPVRLSEETRQFAFDSLNHRYGLDTAAHDHVDMDDVSGFESMTELEKYDAVIRKIVSSAPLRICRHEKLSGAATLGMAITHRIPACYRGNQTWSSISHYTSDFESVVFRGVNGILRDVNDSRDFFVSTDKNGCNKDKIAFLDSCLNTVESMRIYRDRYLEELKKLSESDPFYVKNYETLSRVPFEPATNFLEAVQSIWFTFSFIRLCGNWPGIGRIDYILGDFLKKDLFEGVLTLEEAREILAHLFIKGCEWVKGGIYSGGDAQHYQNLVLAGIDENGNDITNEVTYLVLDIIEELGISDFPTTLRVSRRTPPELIRRAAEVVRHGGGVIAFYNEDTVLKALRDYGYPENEVWKFANDGCWEVQIPGKTYFTYIPFDGLAILQKNTMKEYSSGVSFSSFEELYDAYVRDLGARIDSFGESYQNCFVRESVPSKDWKWNRNMPCTVVSLFEQGCVKKGLSYLEGGPVYNVISPHIGGLADVVNSLYAVKKLVFDEKKISFEDFMTVLRNDWEGYEDLRNYVLKTYSYYGNDNDECDKIAVRLLSDFADCCKKIDGKCGFSFPAGVSTFGRQLEWAPSRLASCHGHKKSEVLAANCSPTPGSDKEGATSIIKSYCKADMSRMVTGAALDVRLLSKNIDGEHGADTIASLVKGFVALGGYFLQPDVQSVEMLRDAQLHPENYQTLSVRVSGWNARFVTLGKDWQNMVISEFAGTECTNYR